jgi:hypothetical protein
LPFPVSTSVSISKSLPARWLTVVQVLGAAFVLVMYTPDVAPTMVTIARILRMFRLRISYSP